MFLSYKFISDMFSIKPAISEISKIARIFVVSIVLPTGQGKINVGHADVNCNGFW